MLPSRILAPSRTSESQNAAVSELFHATVGGNVGQVFHESTSWIPNTHTTASAFPPLPSTARTTGTIVQPAQRFPQQPQAQHGSPHHVLAHPPVQYPLSLTSASARLHWVVPLTTYIVVLGTGIVITMASSSRTPFIQPPAYSILSTPPDMSLTPQQQSLKERFDALLGPDAFDESWSRLLKHSPEMFSASLRLTSVPKRKGHLSPKVQSLVSLSIAAASTHLHVPHIQRYTKQALVNGASKQEIVEVLCLTSTLGIHACNIGVPILFEVLREEGKELPTGMEGMSKEQWELKEEFEKKRGYWHGFWEDFLRLSPEFFGAYVEFSSVPWTNEGGNGVLEPKVKELIYCAFDTAATHLYTPGLKLHMKNVLKYGGTADEIMEVMELATLLSISTMDVGLPILEKELADL